MIYEPIQVGDGLPEPKRWAIWTASQKRDPYPSMSADPEMTIEDWQKSFDVMMTADRITTIESNGKHAGTFQLVRYK